jgi:hypothetical protein
MKSWKENKSKNITVKMVVLIENFNLGYKMSLVLVYRKIIITIN